MWYFRACTRYRLGRRNSDFRDACFVARFARLTHCHIEIRPFAALLIFFARNQYFTINVAPEALFASWGQGVSTGEAICHMSIVIGLLESSHMTCPKTKLRELSLWHVVSLHVCSTFLFLEFNNDIGNHSRTLATATFLTKHTLKIQRHIYFPKSGFVNANGEGFRSLIHFEFHKHRGRVLVRRGVRSI